MIKRFVPVALLATVFSFGALSASALPNVGTYGNVQDVQSAIQDEIARWVGVNDQITKNTADFRQQRDTLKVQASNKAAFQVKAQLSLLAQHMEDFNNKVQAANLTDAQFAELKLMLGGSSSSSSSSAEIDTGVFAELIKDYKAISALIGSLESTYAEYLIVIGESNLEPAAGNINVDVDDFGITDIDLSDEQMENPGQLSANTPR